MLTADIENIASHVDEVRALVTSHYDEVSEHRLHGIELDPNYPVYLARNEAGEIVFVAIREAGNLVGYLISFVCPGLHYQGCLTAIADLFFIRPDHRGMQGGAMLFQAWESECRRRGVKLMAAGIKVRHAKYAGELLRLIGFKEAEIMFWKFLEN